MTAQNSLKRQIRSRMSKTGESYTASRQHFRIAKDSPMTSRKIEFPQTPIARTVQPGLWPDWTAQHPWLTTLLARAEAEARNQGNRECDHFHLMLAYLRLPPPVTEWLAELKVNTNQWKEDTLVAIGNNRDARTIANIHEYGSRIVKARRSKNPVEDVPLERITSEALGMLDLAKSEAELDGSPIDERHFLVPMMDWHPYGEPPIEELRQLTGRS